MWRLEAEGWLRANCSHKHGSKRQLMRNAAWTRVTSAVELLPVLRQRLSWMWTSDVDSRQKRLRLQRQSVGRRASTLCRRRCNVSADGFAHRRILYFPSNMCKCDTFFFFWTYGWVSSLDLRFWEHFRVWSWAAGRHFGLHFLKRCQNCSKEKKQNAVFFFFLTQQCN